MADGILGGISDFFLNRGVYADPNAINPQYGVPEADVRQAGINTLANVSSLLLAAGQPMTGAQRAQLLSGIGPALGGMQTDIYKASQARLMTAQQRNAMQEQQEMEAVRGEMRDPAAFERKYGFKPLPSASDNRQILKQKTLADVAMSPEQKRIRELEIKRLEQQLEEGNYLKAGNDIYRKTPQGLVRITPERDYGFGDISTPTVPPAGAGVAPPDAARPPGVPPVAATPAPETNRFATINSNLDYNRAFGVPGAFNWAAGKVRGALGTEDRATQEAGKAISEVNTLRNSLISATSAEVAGKNLKSTQQRIQELLPSPAAVFTSPAEAVNKFSSVKQLIESDMNDLLFIGSARSGASESDRTKAAQAYRDLRRNRDNINVVIDSLTRGTAPAAREQAPAAGFREGQTAINPQTGERRVFRNGRWEAM
jgi:hypothetical protein